MNVKLIESNIWNILEARILNTESQLIEWIICIKTCAVVIEVVRMYSYFYSKISQQIETDDD